MNYRDNDELSDIYLSVNRHTYLHFTSRYVLKATDVNVVKS